MLCALILLSCGGGRFRSPDLRERLIEAVEMGASRREATERFEVSASSSVRWLQRWHESGSAAPKPRGRSVSPLEEVADRVLAVVAEQPDLTLMQTVAALRRWRIEPAAARSGVSRSTQHHPHKKPASGRAASSRGGARVDHGSKSKACLIPPS